jgi:hypothetical protein
MVLEVAAATANKLLPTRYWLPAGGTLIGLLLLHTLAQGRRTTRERNLHGRVVLLTGAFTPTGLTLLQALAERGAHIIALTPDAVSAPQIGIIVDALRARTANEQIFAETCDFASPASVRAFSTRFLTGNDTRLDAIVLAHEYPHVGPLIPRADRTLAQEEHARTDASMATFLLVTLLLPALLVAPTERDIRIVTLVNPFYAAGLPTFPSSITIPLPSASDSDAKPPSANSSLFVSEGNRAIRTAVFTRHLQRVLDALPNRGQAPPTDAGRADVPVVAASQQRSNIVAVSVSPGFSRGDTAARLLGSPAFASLGLVLYVQPGLTHPCLGDADNRAGTLFSCPSSISPQNRQPALCSPSYMRSFFRRRSSHCNPRTRPRLSPPQA